MYARSLDLTLLRYSADRHKTLLSPLTSIGILSIPGQATQEGLSVSVARCVSQAMGDECLNYMLRYTGSDKYFGPLCTQ